MASSARGSPARTGAAPFLPYAFAALSVLFGAMLSVVVATDMPSTFYALVRGRGMVEFSTSMPLLAPPMDKAVLVASAVALLLVLGSAMRAENIGKTAQSILIFIGVSSALEAVTLQAVFLPFLGVSGTALIGYGILNSPSLLRVRPRRAMGMVLASGVALLSALELLAATRWVMNGFDGAAPFSNATWGASMVELKVFNLAYWTLPRLTLFFLAAWLLRLTFGFYWHELRGALTRLAPRWRGLAGEPSPSIAADSPWVRLLLPVSLLFAVFVGAYAYLPAVNPTSALVGVDVRGFYSGALATMMGSSPASAVTYAFSNERTGYLLLQYLVGGLVGSASTAIRLMPAVLGALLVLASYWFVKAATGNRLLSGTSALFAAFSFQVTAGVDGGLYTNWLAISGTLAFFAAFILGLERRRMGYLLPAVALSILVLYTHPWTWFVLMGIVAAYSLITAVQAKADRQVGGLRFEGLFIGLVVALNLVADATKSLLPTGSGSSTVYSSTVVYMDPMNFIRVVTTLQTTFQIYLGGALANPAIILLSIVGMLVAVNLRSRFDRLLVSWVLVASAGILFTGFSATFLQSRVFYVVPFQVLAAVGFVAIVGFLSRMAAGATEGERGGMPTIFVALAYVSFCSMLLSYALRTVGFLYPGVS